MLKFTRYIAVAVSCFGLGYLSAEVRDHSTPQSNTITADSSTDTYPNNVGLIQATDRSSKDQPLADQQNHVRAQLVQIHQVIDQASPQKVDQYLARAFPQGSIEQIHDRKKMAQRLVDEFAADQNEPDAEMRGKVIVSAQEQTPVQVVSLDQLYKQQQLFAHLDTLNSITDQKQVFIRWIYRDTGEVLLFSPQNVSPQTALNWVSFVPPQGWKVGTYDVRYYQMNDDLKPIAQTSFQIHSVM